MIGTSSFGKAANMTFPILPEIRLGRTETCQSRIIIEGERDCASYIEIAGQLIPLINYMDSKKWFVAAILSIGNNAVYIQSYDNIYHLTSDPVSYSVIRRAIDFTNQGKKYKITANGVDYSDYIKDFSSDSDNKFVTSKADVVLIGNFMNDVNFDYDKIIVVKTNDGFLTTFEKEFEGKIETKSCTINANGAKETKLTLLNEVISGLEKKNTISIQEIYNGQVQKGLFARMDINDIWAFNRFKYTGKRNINDAKIIDIIKELAIVEGQIVDFSDVGARLIPDEYLSYPLFEFDESAIQQISIEQSKSNLINKINVIYGTTDNSATTSSGTNTAAFDEPVTESGYAFYADESLKNEISVLPKTGNITFAAWNKNLDYDLVTDAYIELYHTNVDYKLSNLKYTYPLEIISDKKLAITSIPLGRLNLNKNSSITINVVLSDENKTSYRPNIAVSVEDVAQRINTTINSFDALFTDEQEIANIDTKLSSTGGEGIEMLDASNANIEYISKTFDGKGTIYEFLYKIPVDDVILSTIAFNLMDVNNDAAMIFNGSIVTESNADISGNSYIRAATYSNPKTAFNRVKAIYILFKTLSFSSNEQITLKFKVFGKKFIDSGNYIDYGTLSYAAKNQASIDKYGELDGGYLVSNYLTTPEQTETLAKKIIGFYSLPITTVKLKLPLLSELRKNIMIKVTSPSSGINNYYVINAVNKKFQDCEADSFLLRTTMIRRNQGIESEYEIYARNMRDMQLSPFFNSILSNKGLENGIVTQAHNDGSCDCKVFGTNKKYMRIAVIPNVKTKKDDKVLIATNIDGGKIVIAILEQKVDEIPERNDGSTETNPNTSYEDNTPPVVFSVSPEIRLWTEGKSAEIGKYDSYIGMKNIIVSVTANTDVDIYDFIRRVVIKKGDAIIAAKGAWEITGSYRIRINDLKLEYGTTYKIVVQASKIDPFISSDSRFHTERDTEFEFKTEPKFGIQLITVLNPNAYEVVLTHPIAKGTKLTPANFLLN